MKFAFSSNAFRKTSLLEAIETIAGLGYEGIEIMADQPHAYPPHLSGEDVRSIKQALHEHRLEVSNVNAFEHYADGGDTYHPSWIEADQALRTRRIEHTLRCLDLAAAIGSPSISTEPGGPLEGVSREQGRAYFYEGLKGVEDRARQNGVRVLIEPEPGLLLENSAQFLELYTRLPQDVFGLNFDIGHFFCVGEDPAALVEPLYPMTPHFHLEDIAASRRHHHLIPGDGAIDLTGVLNAIEAIGFEGFVTVELYTYDDHPVEAAARSLEYLRAWRAGHGRLPKHP